MRRAAAICALVLALACGSGTAAAATTRPAKLGRPGTVTASGPLKHSLWIPGARRGFRLEYVTTNAFGKRALSTGEVFIPPGKPPRGGWPVISWAHGTSGLGDACPPSKIGPAEPNRDFPYLATWLDQGYAIVASDYAGLGTPGLMAYLDGRPTAHNIVDMVKAGRAFAHRRLPAWGKLSRRWVALGQSQGGGAAIYTARYATQFGGPHLDYRGAVGTGTPAYIEDYLQLISPGVPPVPALPASTTEYFAYIFASLRYVHPELGINGILTPSGRKYLKLAKTECTFKFEDDLAGANVGDWFTRRPAGLPNWEPTVRRYMGMPEQGFDRPFFMGHGLLDIDVPYPLTALYAAKLAANGEPVTFRTYPGDHNTTLKLSLADTIPFVRRLFNGG